MADGYLIIARQRPPITRTVQIQDIVAKHWQKGSRGFLRRIRATLQWIKIPSGKFDVEMLEYLIAAVTRGETQAVSRICDCLAVFLKPILGQADELNSASNAGEERTNGD